MTRALVLPTGSAEEAGLVDGLVIYAAGHLLEVVRALLPGDASSPLPRAVAPLSGRVECSPDLRDVKGQSAAKRALEIAAAGGHSLLTMSAQDPTQHVVKLRHWRSGWWHC